MKKGFYFRMRQMKNAQNAEGEASPEETPQPDPIRTYTDTTGRFIKIMEPRFAEGYEGQYQDSDLARRRRQIIEGK